MKKRAKNRTPDKSAKILYLPLLCLLASGCSYYGGQLSYFDLTDDNKKTLANRKAAEKFWSSVRPKSNLSDAHYRLGLHYQQVGEYDKAIGEFNKALRNDRNYCKAFNGIAMTYDLMKRCEPAHDSYEQAVTCAPGEAFVYNNYACSSLLCGDYGKGLELLQKAESLAATEIRIKNNLRIARTIAIHENISEYTTVGGSGSPLSATTDKTPSSPEHEKTQSDPVQAVPESDLSLVTRKIDISDKPADDPAAPAGGIVIEPPAREIVLAPPQDAEVVHLSVENNKKIAVSAPVVALPVPVNVAVEVSNGNGTTGMAKRSADFLRGHGFTVRSITNAKHFRFEESVIYYKEGFLQAAKDLAAIIPGAQNLEEVETLAKTSVSVKVVLGKDLVTIRFPEYYTGLADYRQTEQLQNAVITASNHPVHY